LVTKTAGIDNHLPFYWKYGKPEVKKGRVCGGIPINKLKKIEEPLGWRGLPAEI
jgi:hypothetical protein